MHDSSSRSSSMTHEAKQHKLRESVRVRVRVTELVEPVLVL